jgi:hypothetical protein
VVRPEVAPSRKPRARWSAAAHLLEQVGHAEGARLVGHDGHDARTQLRVLEQAAQHAHKGHGGAHFLAAGGQRELRVLPHGRHGHGVAHRLAARQRAAQGCAARTQVLHLGAVLGGLVEGQALGLLVAERQVEAVAEFDQVRIVQLLLAVGGHLALAGRSHAVALLGMGQDHRGLAAVGSRRRIGRMDLHQVMAAALQAVDLLVGQPLGQGGQFRALAEEMLAVVAPILGSKGLHLPIDRGAQGLGQRACEIAREQPVPVAAPQQLDHVPARAREQPLQFVDDAAIAALRAVQPLQIAVDHPDQVVQPLACGQREGAHAFGLVHLAVAEHAPDLAALAVQQMAVREVAHEARVVDAADGPYAHGARGKLPEIGHQPGMGVAGQPLGTGRRRADLLPVVLQVLLVQPPFEEGARIDAGRAVRLEEHQVAPVLARSQPLAAMEEMVEAGLEQIGRAGIAGNVAAQFAIGLVGAHHHGQRVPAHDGGQPLFQGEIAREQRLRFGRHAVQIGRVEVGLPAQALLARQAREFLQHEARALRPLGGGQGQEGFAPFGSFLGIGVDIGQRGQRRGCVHANHFRAGGTA